MEQEQHGGIQNLWATAMKVFWQKYGEWNAKQQEQTPLQSRILMFHDVCPEGETPVDAYACTISALENSIRYHQSHGFTFVSLDELLNMPPAEALSGKCVLTFDDGYAHIASCAAPWLNEHDIPYTLYICTDLLNKDGYLSGSELQKLAENPLCTVGSHGVSHRMLRFLPRRDARNEFSHSKTVLESMLGRPVRHFAFPYGSGYACGHRESALAKRCGYATAALTLPVALSSLTAGSLYRLPRMNMPHTEP